MLYLPNSCQGSANELQHEKLFKILMDLVVGQLSVDGFGSSVVEPQRAARPKVLDGDLKAESENFELAHFAARHGLNMQKLEAKR